VSLSAATVWSVSSGPEDGDVPRSETPSQDTAPSGATFIGAGPTGWRGERQRLRQAGVTIELSLVLEGFNNFVGGLRTSSLAGASTFDLSLAVDTQKSLSWKGGKFYVDLEDHAGRDPSNVLVGDLQVFDKLNSEPYLQVFELWYQQGLLDDMLRFKAGKVDANNEFSVIDNGLSFINSSTQVSPTVFLLPTTPAPMPSVNVFWTPSRSFCGSFGAYYANQSVGFGNFSGAPQDAQVSKSGTFLIGETGVAWQRSPILRNDGNLKLGAWGHTGTFSRFDGSRQRGTYGGYAILDETLWQPAGEPRNGRGARAFLVYGRTQESINAIDQHVGAGVTWTGVFTGRPDDSVGFSPEYAFLSRQAGLPHSYELAMEAFYKLKVTPWATLMADLQYIVNPGGQYANALVGTLRLQVTC
jgi:porin